MERKSAGGQITIFISLIMMCVFALFCGLTESARTAGARWYLQTAASSALDSVFSQYHRGLWDTYRLLFAEYEDEDDMMDDFAMFLNPYLETAKWYPMSLEDTKTGVWLTAVDDNGMYLEQEILDYMKYGKWKLDFEADTPQQLQELTKEAGAVKKVEEKYRGHSKEALKLENALEAISGNQDQQAEKKEEGLSALSEYDCSEFLQVAQQLIRVLEKVPSLVTEYQRQADRLAENLKESRQFYEGESADCSEDVSSKLDNEIREYESYVDEDGKRRKEVEALTALSGQQIALVREVMEEAQEVEEIIENWDSGDDDDDDEDSDEPDYEALWSPVIQHFEQLEIRRLSFRHGVKDKEKEGILKRVENLYQSGLLKLVVPDGVKVSDSSLDTGQLPSHTESWSSGTRNISLYHHLLVNEYTGKFFRNFRTALEEQKDEIGISGSGGLAYEMEYMIGGKNTDEANLTAVVNRLLAVREGLNFVYLLSDGQKREEARSLAMTVTGVTGLAPLVLLTTFFILSVWALGEALMDVRGLLAGNKVPLLKSSETWTLTIENLLKMGQNGRVETGGGSQGLGYLAWLKILLFGDEIVQQEYRMMDMVQMNIRRKQNSFRMRRGVYQAEITASLKGKHVFFSPWFVEQIIGSTDHTYPMSITVERVY
jgi:hypothetical protein